MDQSTDHATAPPVPAEPAPATGRESRLLTAFVELANGLVNDPDPQELLHQLAEQCLALLGVDVCGILLRDGEGPLTLVAAVPHDDRILEVFQLQSHEGPCIDAVRSGRPIHSSDLTADGNRWPRWTAVALGLDFHMVYATPLRTSDQILGALNLFSRHPRQLGDADLMLVRALADVATLTILQQRVTLKSTVIRSQLQAALTSRIVIEQAKGIVSQGLDVSMDTAFGILRHSSRSTNKKLSVVAARLVDATIRPIDLVRPQSPPRR